ncbi:DUF72 domain-containing protein [Gracilimonas mengyeensis]|uniref:Uncharacterized conserved protein YecE, DUF72 family n=1 Tax=Gracilimonas mengyeensis TaxID=1302730 RepID=A0A521CVW5_9BACT|nr:DUF72 domain-containing protein [Gracilimonas mengyeensis]SMO63552.1 Uncharacterized conserved protein YecE, DUF72 family [Gracilimonas mengyeensis]
MQEWKGSFFRDDAKPGQFLSQYASVFNSVEGNTTFYSVPDPETIQKWGEQTPKGFKFCFKFPRYITHEKRMHNAKGDVLDFVRLFEPIREKVGPFMIQLPDSFSPNELYRLEEVLSVLPKSFRYSVEVRHRDFFDHGKHERNLVSLLKSYDVDRVIFDTRKLHSVKSQESSILEAQKKKPKVPVRFDNTASRPILRYVGTNDIINNEPYLKEWAIIVAEWIDDGLHPYIFIHAPNKADQPKLCRHFHKLLSNLIDVPELPAWPSEKQNKQLGLF